MLKETTGAFYPIINFIGIHMVPTVIVYAVTLPIVTLITNLVEFNFWAVIPIVVSLLAVLMQGTADVQMHKFRKAKTGGFIRVGLWKYSRHPNYLGEILMWWGIGAYAVVVMPTAWYLIIGAVLNTVLFLSVSIPMADRRQSRKDGFNEYKMATRMLLPIKKSVKQL
jgi:steroid 5-alpha reductase family enzyme